MQPCPASLKAVAIVCRLIFTTKATSTTYLNCDRKKNKTKSPVSFGLRSTKNGRGVCPIARRRTKGRYMSGSLCLSPVAPESGDIPVTGRRKLSFLCPRRTSVLRKSACVSTAKRNGNRRPKTGKNYCKRSTGPIRSFGNG